MKYLVLLCDGMADMPNKALSDKTPMECADKPYTDALAALSEAGMCRTVAEGLKPGSDVANLSVMGYDPKICYTGRSPLEAASIGVDLKPTDVALRCNIVTLSNEDDYEDKTMLDYCAGDISTEEARLIMETVEERLGGGRYEFYSGVSYRHCLVVKDGTTELGSMTPPHDISGKVIGEYLSSSENAAPLIELMKKSYDILKNHPVNLERRKKGLHEANSIWLWGEGRRPKLEDFRAKNGVSGCVVSAVDLLKGIGICAGMETPLVEGATGYIDTDFIEAPHGRAPAIATGFKRIRPDRVIFTYQGDGDLASIGAAEIVHAANRSENITVIFINNAIYGMTGGQMAPTTLIGQRTTTTQDGRDPQKAGYPMRISEMLSTLASPMYVERVCAARPAYLPALKMAIRKSFQNQLDNKGFSFVEVLSTCPTNWGLRPKEACDWLVENMIPYYPLGVKRDFE